MEKFDYKNNNCVVNTFLTNLNMNSDFEEFVFPDLLISGTTKINTGLTESSVGVYELPENINLTFIVTGNTVSFNKCDIFGFKIIKWNDSFSGFTDTVFTKEIDTDNFIFYQYSEIIGTEFLQYTPDSQYIINPYYKFTGTTEPNGKLIYNSTENFILPNLEYENYSPDYSNYFAIYNEPSTELFNVGEIRIFEGTYNYEKLDVVVGGQTEFFLSKVPSKIINLNVNGLSLLYGDDLTGDIEFTNELNKVIIKSGLTITDDIITIQYIVDDNQPEFYVDSFYVDNLNDRVTLNTGTTKYEFLLENIPNGDVTLILNGLKLNEGVDFYKSITIPNLLIFHEISMEIGDTIIALYGTDLTIGNVYSSAVTINFQSNLEQKTGEFLLEVTDFTDTNFLNPIFSASTDYSFNGLYDTQKGLTYEYFLTFSPIQIGDTYIARIKNTKEIDFVEFSIESSSFSDIITFKAGDNSVESY